MSKTNGVALSDTLFTTERLQVRRWRESDLPALNAVYGDADAMRWVGEGRAITPEECERWLDITLTNYTKRGYGMFAVQMASAPEAIGFCGLVHPGGQPEPELKYAYGRAWWGRGIATEAAIGLIAYGAQAFGMRHIIATAAPPHTASHRVLLKAGMQRGDLRDNDDGSQTQLFHWTLPDESTQ